MNNLKNTLSQLKKKGYRFSAVRNCIINEFDKNKAPLSAPDLHAMLKKNKLSVNKTTVYRELDALEREGIILKMQLKDNKKWYELTSREHHHHIICTNCNKVEDFDGCDSNKIINKALKQAPSFAEITSHNFDFFGLCKSCAKK